MKALLILLLSLSAGHALGDVLEQVLTDQAGTPLSGILVRATKDGEEVTTRADAEGRFRLDLEGGPWWVEVDPVELLERGYFCVPGSWFPGGEPFILAVNLSPELALKKTIGGAWFVEMTFDWLSEVDPVIARQCRVERSEDGVTWESLGTVMLTNPPIRVVDPDTTATKCFYRTVDVGSLSLRPIPWPILLPL